MPAPIRGMKTVPEYHDNDILMGMFIGLFKFAWCKEEIRNQFKVETGIDLDRLLPKNPLEAMIDKATGHTGETEIIAFADWVNVNMWGEDRRGDEA